MADFRRGLINNTPPWCMADPNGDFVQFLPNQITLSRRFNSRKLIGIKVAQQLSATKRFSSPDAAVGAIDTFRV